MHVCVRVFVHACMHVCKLVSGCEKMHIYLYMFVCVRVRGHLGVPLNVLIGSMQQDMRILLGQRLVGKCVRDGQQGKA